MTSSLHSHPSISRRAVLRLLAAGGGSAFLAACGGTPSPNAGSSGASATAAPAVAPTPASTAAQAAAAPTAAPTAALGATQASAAPTTAAAAAPTSAPAASAGVTIQVATRGGTDGATMEKNAATYKDKFGVTVRHVSYGGQPEYWAKIRL